MKVALPARPPVDSTTLIVGGTVLAVCRGRGPGARGALPVHTAEGGVSSAVPQSSRLYDAALARWRARRCHATGFRARCLLRRLLLGADGRAPGSRFDEPRLGHADHAARFRREGATVRSTSRPALWWAPPVVGRNRRNPSGRGRPAAWGRHGDVVGQARGARRKDGKPGRGQLETEGDGADRLQLRLRLPLQLQRATHPWSL